MSDADLSRLIAGYAIVGERRCGSTYLCELLASTGVLGLPSDYFNPNAAHGMAEPAARLGLVAANTTANGIYGVKVFPDEFEAMAGLAWAARLPGLRFVHLRRRDVLGQAISAARAVQTRQWFSTAPSIAGARYDGKLIARHLRAIVVSEGRWRSYFARNGIAPLLLDYEDVVAEPQAAVEAIATLVGLAERPRIDLSRTTLRTQRDGTSTEWRARFLDEQGDLARLERLANVPIKRWAALRWPRLAGLARRLRDR